MTSFRTFVIANPSSGAGAVRREWEPVKRLLSSQVETLDVAFTEGPGHATLLAREALRAGWEMIVAVGGDGTLNEVVNGFFEKTDVKEHFELKDGFVQRKEKYLPKPINPNAVFGFIPMGTGGDFRRTVGAMGGPAETVKVLGGHEFRTIDVGHVVYVSERGPLEFRTFLNVASAGIGGLVDRMTNSMWKGLGGKLSFGIASGVTWFKYTNRPLTVRFDDLEELQDRFFNVVVANGEYFGGGMWVAPGAEIDNGKLQVVVFADLSRSDSATLIRKIYRAEHLNLEGVTRRNAHTIAIRPESQAPLYLDIDGEAPGQAPATFFIHSGALRLKTA
jgi:diacylglycerol kinase family enzyme